MPQAVAQFAASPFPIPSINSHCLPIAAPRCCYLISYTWPFSACHPLRPRYELVLEPETYASVGTPMNRLPGMPVVWPEW